MPPVRRSAAAQRVRATSARRRRLIIALLVLAVAGAGVGYAAFGPSGKSTRARPVTTTRPKAPRLLIRRDLYAADAVGAPLARIVRGVRARVYVPNSVSGTVDVIDPKTFRIVSHFRVGNYAQHITPSWDLRWLYVNNTLSNSLTVINPRTARPVRTLRLSNPYNLYFTPDGTKAIVVAESLVRLDFRDSHSFRLIKSVPIPGTGPNHLDFSADGRFLLISCEFSGYVVRVDVRRMRVTGRLFVGGQPIDVKVSPDGRVFYVANMMRGGVSVIDPYRLREIAFLHTGVEAHGLAVSRDATTLYVANRAAGTISLIDLAHRRVTRTWPVGGNPDMLQITPDGRQIWVSNRSLGTVSVINTRTGQVLHVIRVGRSPHGLTYFPQQGRYSLGHNGVYR